MTKHDPADSGGGGMTPKEIAHNLVWVNDPDMDRIFIDDRDVRFDLADNVAQVITEAEEAAYIRGAADGCDVADARVKAELEACARYFERGTLPNKTHIAAAIRARGAE